jgi:trimethylamine--corrinoid protein Co-methyltransferase
MEATVNSIESFGLRGGLSREQIDIMHNRALSLVEEVGIQIPHDGILRILADYDGVHIDGNMVTFRSDLVMKALKEAVYDVPEYDDWVIDAGAHQTSYYDLDTKKLRQPTMQDLIDTIKLGDSLDTVGSAAVVPLDVPVHLQLILMHKVSYDYSRYRCNDIYEHMDKPTPQCADYIYEMAQVAGKRFTFGVWMISPRSFDKNGLKVVYHLLDKGVPMWISTMPVAGVSAPITMISTLLQSMFEHFAGLTMLNLINTKSNNYIAPDDAFEADPFDMRYSTFVYGSAEYTRATLHKIALCNYYNIPVIAKSLNTAGKEPDAQAAFEVGQHSLIAALAGARAFRTGGLLSAGEIYSAEMLVIIREIFDYLKNVIGDELFSYDRFMEDEIREVGPGQSFVGRKSTFDNFKNEYWEPALFNHCNLGQWKSMGSKTIWEYANELVKNKIKEHTYRADEHVRKELDLIYARAREDEQLIDSFKFVKSNGA